MPDNLTQEDYNLLVRALDKRVKWLEDNLDFGPPPLEEVDEEQFYEAYLDSDSTDEGFAVQVFLRNVHLVGKFSSFQFKANFPPGVNFLRAVKGTIIEDFGFGFQALDGHPKEGLVGGYASSMDAVDGLYDGVENDELFVTLHFSGPLGAAFGVNLTQFKLSYGATTLPGDLPANITAA